jgi:dihydropteroate synthase
MAKDTLFYKKRTIRCNNRIIELNDPLVMGILNVTPDSFYDGGRYTQPKELLIQADKMVSEGADIIDVGGYSSRPGAKEISAKEEINRISGTLEQIRNKYPEIIISLDTFRAEVASHAISNYHIDIVNDISAGQLEPEILDVVAESKVAYIAMHMQGNPQTMQEAPQYKHVVKDILEYFAFHIDNLRSKKIDDIIIDPGFGFGKTLDQNYQLLAGLDAFKLMEYPMLVGISRKSMIYNFLETDAQDALTGTIALHIAALQKGAQILRVHDVKETRQTIDLYKKLETESEKSLNLLYKTQL